MIECYSGCEEKLQPVVSIYPGFLNLRLYDRLYEKIETNIYDELSGTKKRVLELLQAEGPKHVKELQAVTDYKSRSQFLREILNPLIESGVVYREGNIKSPKSLIVLNVDVAE